MEIEISKIIARQGEINKKNLSNEEKINKITKKLDKIISLTKVLKEPLLKIKEIEGKLQDIVLSLIDVHKLQVIPVGQQWQGNINTITEMGANINNGLVI